MDNTDERTGHCLCGKVAITARRVDPHASACHCSMCRRWGGSALMAVDCGSDVAFEGAESITTYKSSPWAERGFCKACGTHLFYRIAQSGEYILPVGLFDDIEGITLEQQIFIDEKPGYYAYANQTENMTGAEVFAKFAPPPA